jgi:hypothetical protein
MTNFLFDLPAWFVCVMFALSVGVIIYGNNRTQRPVVLAGLGLLGLSVVLTAVSWFVDTPLEASIRRTHDIVAAVNARDWARVESLMNKQTKIASLTGGKEITTRGSELADTFGLKSVNVLKTDSSIAGDTGLMDVTVTLQHEFTQSMAAAVQLTSWTFSYEKMRDGILLSKVEIVGRDGVPVSRVNAELRK